jgi:hypothetical protein
MKVEETELNGIPVRTVSYEQSDMATAEQKETWMSTCNTCEYKKDSQCGFCGCIIESLMMLKTGKCPADKWQ